MPENLLSSSNIEIRLVANDEEVLQILKLQQSNLPQSLTNSEMADQGFVTVEHDPEILLEMNRFSPSLVAVHQQQVIGYALVMPVDYRSKVPILEPMFRLIDNFTYENLPLASYNYFIMGQVCIEKNYRGTGLFDQLYAGLYRHLSNRYRLLITEVASRNRRSMNAHLRAGLKVIHQYTDPRGEQWELLVWDWENRSGIHELRTK